MDLLELLQEVTDLLIEIRDSGRCDKGRLHEAIDCCDQAVEFLSEDDDDDDDDDEDLD